MDFLRAVRDWFDLSDHAYWCSSRSSPRLAFCWVSQVYMLVPAAFEFHQLEPNPSLSLKAILCPGCTDSYCGTVETGGQGNLKRFIFENNEQCIAI